MASEAPHTDDACTLFSAQQASKSNASSSVLLVSDPAGGGERVPLQAPSAAVVAARDVLYGRNIFGKSVLDVASHPDVVGCLKAAGSFCARVVSDSESNKPASFP
jgi:hypothetical protein